MFLRKWRVRKTKTKGKFYKFKRNWGKDSGREINSRNS